MAVAALELSPGRFRATISAAIRARGFERWPSPNLAKQGRIPAITCHPRSQRATPHRHRRRATRQPLPEMALPDDLLRRSLRLGTDT